MRIGKVNHGHIHDSRFKFYENCSDPAWLRSRTGVQVSDTTSDEQSANARKQKINVYKLNLKPKNTPKRCCFTVGSGCGNTRHIKSTRKNLKILSIPVPTSRYNLPSSDLKG